MPTEVGYGRHRSANEPSSALSDTLRSCRREGFIRN